jgi:hypothetical protein
VSVRGIVAVAIAMFIGAQVVRNAAVMALAQTKPAAAAHVWRRHPATEIFEAMIEIASAARDRRAVPASAFASMADAAIKDPLASEPFLVRGVQAELSGNGRLAQRAFEAAQWRDPRSLPAAYFLADRYFRTGDVSRGLTEIATLARLSPNGSQTVAPYLAAYARNPANWPAVRSLFRANPGLSDPTLIALASKIETAPAVLALADPQQKPGEGHWLEPLLNTLTRAGQYGQARAIWMKAGGAQGGAGELLHDTSFSDRSSPPPFNWSLSSSTVGLAERQPAGRLHVIFYGQEDGFLASQLMLLPSGAYRLSMQLLGDPVRARALSWSVWCDKAGAPLVSATIDAVAARSLRFEVPAGCAAQWIRLTAASSDISQQTDVTIAALKLERSGPGA